MKQLEVAALVLIEKNRVFAAQRKAQGPQGGKWEFPGGKVEAGETGQEALVREIQEELALSIEVERYLLRVEHHYPDFFIILHAYLGRRKEGTIQLREHQRGRWVKKEELLQLDWAEADLPIVRDVAGLLS
ncbi:MAG: (deoxy)nucleoside triphosphate pyrophosphohydrolase [Sphaerochaetaceae bacterium]